MGEPMEGGIGATTHNAQSQKGGWGRGGDALGAGEEGGTEDAARECWGQTTGEREGKAGGGRRDNTRGCARTESYTIGEPMGSWKSFLAKHRQEIIICSRTVAGKINCVRGAEIICIGKLGATVRQGHG